ncbi:tellurite resistance TerB family protein [Ancylothrix sp. C2]|uniref:tellurite resistance TerB family protein n=1 Tax=Ancylothrix sp. D3o TaxID=2953691 RepID=UPI0021BB3EDD|nr:tellurite resistance TerB family protein [Ancylothrix sp. D3o]MCT7952768.1 tellurite resistance TerB family protein [Ancylothrix sp. D3o]
MGRYDAIFAVEEELDTEFTPEEAVLAIGTVALFADGQPTDEENAILTDVVNNYGLFDEYAAEDIQAVLDKIIAIINQQGLGVLFNTAVNSLSEDMVESAFEVAAAVVLSDEVVDESEDSFLGALAEALELDEEAAQDIIDALLEEVEEEEEV